METQISQPQEYTDAFKQNLTCIFLSVRAILKETFQCETPCMYKNNHALSSSIKNDFITLWNVDSSEQHQFKLTILDDGALCHAKHIKQSFRSPTFRSIVPKFKGGC